MGFFSNVFRSVRFRRSLAEPATATNPRDSLYRRCQFEQMEERRVMAADAIHLGAVYYDPASGEDTIPNTFQIQFSGGAPGTQLTHLQIDTDKLGDGLNTGDPFFNTAPGGNGVYGSHDFQVVSSDGITITSITVVNGGHTLDLTFSGFTAGKTLIFSIDVDEIGLVPPASATVEGAEFAGSHLSATFTAPRYFDLNAQDTFVDAFDPKFAGMGLTLSPDNYDPPNPTPSSVLTAGALAQGTQIVKPNSLGGVVYEDKNLDNMQELGDPGIAGVPLSLLVWNGTDYVATGKTTTTAADGSYFFDNLDPGKYRVVETQPGGYFSVGATVGKVNGVPDGVLTTVNVISDIVLLGDDHSVRNDFAEALPGTISGYVYYDPNNNGLIDPGEPGIANTTIDLYDAGLNLVTKAVTDANGYYQFTGLMPGSYILIEEPPPNYLLGKDTVGPAGGVLVPPTGIADIPLFSGGNAPFNDFGHLLPASISGIVHVDNNGDCIYQPGEPLLAGVTIELYDATTNALLGTTVTDVNGHYEFDNLAPFATYRVHEVAKAGYFEFGGMVGSAGGLLVGLDTITNATLNSGVNATDYNFCVQAPASIAGIVHVDNNGDCIYQPGEKLLSGVTVQLLDANNVVVGTTVTDVDGKYKFSGLKPGTYSVHEVQPVGYFEFGDMVGTAGGTNPTIDNLVGAVLGSGVDATDYNFCVQAPASIAGIVHVDNNGDCIYQPGEKLLSGVTIQLLDANNAVVGTTVTDVDGKYKFSGLKPGTYSVHEVQPVGYFEFGDMVGTAGGTNPTIDTLVGAVLGSGVDATGYNFCVVAPASIAGMIHVDTNGDCIYQPGEPLLSGVTVQLLDANNVVVGTTTTDSNGQYKFSGLKPGTYTVHELQPVGYFEFGGSVGSSGGILVGLDTIKTIGVDSGEDATDYNFCVQLPASIGGMVHIDTNGDCIYQPGEPLLAGVTIELLNANNIVVGTTTTDVNGQYLFTGLQPGTYTVHEVQPGGFTEAGNSVGSAGGILLGVDTISAVPLGSGVNATDYNFCVTTPGFIPLSPFTTPNLQPMANPPDLKAIIPIWTPEAVTPPFSLYYGGGYSLGYTWHLSIIDAGQPRGGVSTPQVALISMRDDPFQMPAGDIHDSEWILGLEDQEETGQRLVRFGLRNGIPVTGDFNGDGITDVGFYYKGQWYIDLNSNGKWDDGDLWAKLGHDGDMPVTGDWDGDGKTDIGIFGRAWPGDPSAIRHEPGLPAPLNAHTGQKKNVPPRTDEAALGYRTLKHTSKGDFRADLIDHVFHYGTPGDIPVTGDWHGTGVHTIGLFYKGRWILDSDGDGKATSPDHDFQYGVDGDLPLVGDFNGDGIDELGVYRAGTWYVDTNNDRVLDARDKLFELGGPHDVPVVGDWDGDGVDEPGVYHNGGEGPTPTMAAPAASE